MVGNPFRRTSAVPAGVLAAAGLDRGEKVLAATASRDGVWLLGTRDALVIVRGASDQPEGEGVEPEGRVVEPEGRVVEPVETRIPWQQVERADWDRDAERLTVTEVGQFGRVRPEYTFAIDEPGQLLAFIRERVTASVVLQRHVPVTGKKGLFVVARRAPRGDGEISWAYEFQPGIDPDDPDVMAAAKRGLERAAEELGL